MRGQRMILAMVTGGALLSGCAMGRLASYGSELADAQVNLGAAQFQLYIHPQDDTVLVQRSLNQTATNDPPAIADAAVSTLLAPAGCVTTSVSALSPGAFEVGFSCPPGIDIRRLAIEQRQALKAGQSLRVTP